MYNYWQIGAENCGKEPLASNQVVGSSNLSGRAIISTTYGALTIYTLLLETRFSYWILIFKAVTDDWGTVA